MNKQSQTQKIKRFPVIGWKGKFKRPVVKVDFPKSEHDFSCMAAMNFNGSKLDEPNLFGWIYVKFSDGLQSFLFASKGPGSGCYLVN